jgi:hypothetical protein
MAVKPTYKAERPSVCDEKKDYEIVREWKKEREHVMALEKELKKHEKTSLQEAHPLPNMRK